MKKLIPLIFLLASCNVSTIDQTEAQKAVENLIKKVQQKDYKSLSEIYSFDFNKSETEEARIKKFQKLEEVVGPVKSFKLLDLKKEDAMGEESDVIATYKVEHTKVPTIEKFVVIYEDGGCKVSAHSIRTED